jgi:outer membrane protein
MKTVLWFVLGLGLTVGGAARAADDGVLTLDQALRLARANHPQLQAAHAQTEASAARIDVARASLLPQIGGSAYYQRAQRGGGTGTLTAVTAPGGTTSGAVGLSPNTGSAYYFGLTANQLIYDFGQATGKWNAAKATLRSQEQSEREFLVRIAFNLRAAYYSTAAARALVKVAEETLHNQELHLRQIQGFVEAGTRPEIDLAQARTDRANAEVQLINAQVGFDTNKALLNQAMGIERGTDYDIAEPPPTAVGGEDGTTDALLATALGARPELLSLARQIESQELTTSAIKGAYAPSLGLSAGLSESGPALDELSWAWSARLSLSWQIFGGGITRQQVREARAATAALRAQYELQRQQVRADVEQARLGVRAAKAAIGAAQEAAANARIRLTLAEGRYQAGVGSVIELGDSQLALTTASAQEVQARFNLATARARLLQALGQP